MTPSMRTALEDLQLDHITVIYPDPHSFALDPAVTVVSIQDLYTKTNLAPPSH